MFRPESPEPKQGRSYKETRTLTVLVGAAFLFFGAFIVIPIFTPDSGDVAPITSEASDWQPVEVIMGLKPIRLPAELEAQIQEETEELRALKEPDPFLHLLSEVNRRSYRFFRKDGFEDASPRDLLANPAAVRGRSVALKGELVHAEEKEPERKGEGAIPPRITEGVIKTDFTGDDGEPYYASFFLPGVYPGNIRFGDVVRVEGVFFKSGHFDTNPVGRPSFRTGPLIVAKKVMKSFYTEEVEALDPGKLAQIDDSIDAAKILEFEPLFHTIGYVKHLLDEKKNDPAPPGDEADKKSSRFILEGKQLRENPADYRGEFVRLIGRLEWLQKEPLEANPAGIDTVYRAILRSQDRILVESIFLEKPTKVILGKAVEIEGVFFKNHAYLNQTEGKQNQFTWSPYIVGYSIRQPVFEDAMFTRLQSLVLFVAVGLAAVFSFVLVRDRRKTRAFVESHREKRKAARQGRNINTIAREARRKAAETRSE